MKVCHAGEKQKACQHGFRSGAPWISDLAQPTGQMGRDGPGSNRAPWVRAGAPEALKFEVEIE